MTEGSRPQTQREKMKALWEAQPNQKRYRRLTDQTCVVDLIVDGAEPCKARVFTGPLLCAEHAGTVARLRKVREYRRPEPLPVDPQVSEANRKVFALQNETLRLKREIQRLKAIKDPDPTSEKPKRTAPEEGHVYLLLSDNLVKIGWASDLDARMKQYSPGARILAVMPGTKKDETRLHRKFSDLKANRREWFTYHPRLMEEAERIVKEHGEPPRELNEPMQTRRVVGPRLDNYTQRRARSLRK